MRTVHQRPNQCPVARHIKAIISAIFNAPPTTIIVQQVGWSYRVTCRIRCVEREIGVTTGVMADGP